MRSIQLVLVCLVLVHCRVALSVFPSSELCTEGDLLLPYLMAEYHRGDRSSSKFLVVQYMTENIFGYGSVAFACTAWWSKLQGYGLELFTPERVESVVASSTSLNILPNQVAHELDHRWQKVWLLPRHLHPSLVAHAAGW